MHLPGLSHSCSGTRVVVRGADSVRPAFCALPRLSSSGDPVFGECGHCDLSPPLSLPLGFPGIQPARLLRRMSTIQNPEKSWLATKPTCSLVDDASLGPRLPLPALAALVCLSPAGNGPVCSWLALLSPLFCEWAWQCLRLGLFMG